MDKLKKYRLLEKLGDGPQGTVYRAQDLASMQWVAIRTLGAALRSDPTAWKRFEDECHELADLKHPNIACVHECGDDGGIPFVVTEWLSGRDLKTVVAERQPLLLEQKLTILLQLGEALEYAGSKGLVHRDLHPGRIHFGTDGKIKVRDFGTLEAPAPAANPPDRPRGSRRYMAPEQAQGADATVEANVYALGVIAYEFCTGAHPLPDWADDGTAGPSSSQPNIPTVEQFPELPLGLWPIIEKCLAVDPAERFPSPAEFSGACRDLLGELAEDSQLLLTELQNSLPRLHAAAGTEGAPPEIPRLAAEVEGALRTGVKTGYQRLNRLAADLAEHSARLLPSVSAQSPFLFEPDETQAVASADAAPAVSAAAASAAAAASPPPPPVAAGTEIPVSQPEAVPADDAGIVPDEDHEDRACDPAASSDAVQEQAGVEPPVPPLHATSDSMAPAVAESAAALCDAPLPEDAPGTERAILLLKEIDQARETLQKAIERFHAEQSGQMAVALEPAAAPEGRRSPADQAVPAPQVAPADPHPLGGAFPDEPDLRRTTKADADGNLPGEKAGADGTAAIPASPSNRQSNATILWVLAPAILLGIVLGTVSWWRNRQFQWGAPSPDPAPAANTQTAPQAPATPAERAGSLTAPEVRRNILLEEARTLHAAGMPDQSRVFLNRLLELHPGYQPALAEIAQIESEGRSAAGSELPIPEVQKLLAGVSSAIKTGDLARAKTILDQAGQLQPGLRELATWRRRWQARKTELAAIDAREQEKQKELELKQKIDLFSRQADELFRQAKYSEALALAEEQLGQDSQFMPALELRIRTSEAQRNLKAYESALASRQYSEALAALDRLERINPADPNLAASRKRVETESGGGRAVLSVYSLGEPAELMLDDRPAGSKGELPNKTIPTGRHRISVRNNLGLQIEQAVDLTDGQATTIVYDLAAKVMRPMTETDREMLNRREARRQVHRFAVEHVHGLFRGSCKGTLAVNSFDVEFTPGTGDHAFSRPFKNLRLKINDRTAVLLSAVDNKEFNSFKFPDAAAAQALKKAWDSLVALDR